MNRRKQLNLGNNLAQENVKPEGHEGTRLRDLEALKRVPKRTA
jgi:hypothetical protein